MDYKIITCMLSILFIQYTYVKNGYMSMKRMIDDSASKITRCINFPKLAN